MEKKDLKPGIFIYTEYNKSPWIVEVGVHIKGDAYDINYFKCMECEATTPSVSESGRSAWGNLDSSVTRLATPIEIRWLLESVDAGRIIKKPVEDDYSIY